MSYLATIDGSLRTNEEGTLDAVNTCFEVAYSGKVCQSKPLHTIMMCSISAREAYFRAQSDDEQTALDARDDLDILMQETMDAMYELGYLAYWDEGCFYIEKAHE